MGQSNGSIGLEQELAAHYADLHDRSLAVLLSLDIDVATAREIADESVAGYQRINSSTLEQYEAALAVAR